MDRRGGRSRGKVSIKDTKPFSAKHPLFLVCLPGAGMAGRIAGDFLVEELGMEEVAYIESDLIPPFVTVENGKVQRPIRIYFSRERSLLALEGSMFIPPEMIYFISNALVEWLEKHKVREVAVLMGCPKEAQKERPRLICAATDGACLRLKGLDPQLEIMEKGIISGLPGVLLVKCEELGIRGVCLMAEASEDMPDPKAALTLLEGLNRYYELNIDTTRLLIEAAEMKKELNELLTNYAELKAREKTDKPRYIF